MTPYWRVRRALFRVLPFDDPHDRINEAFAHGRCIGWDDAMEMIVNVNGNIPIHRVEVAEGESFVIHSPSHEQVVGYRMSESDLFEIHHTHHD